MNRQEFFRRLEYLLRGIPENERMDAMAYYNDYFDDAGVENEQRVIQELGSPETVAQMILEDYRREQQKHYGDYYSSEMEYEGKNQQRRTPVTLKEKIKNMSRSTKILLILLLVITFPIWIGVVAGLFGGAVGLLGGLFGLVVGLGGAGIGVLVGGVMCIGGGILCLLTSPAEGVVMVGVGALLTAIAILLMLFFALLAFQWFPCFVRAIIKRVKGVGNCKEGGDEI